MDVFFTGIIAFRAPHSSKCTRNAHLLVHVYAIDAKIGGFGIAIAGPVWPESSPEIAVGRKLSVFVKKYCQIWAGNSAKWPSSWHHGLIHVIFFVKDIYNLKLSGLAQSPRVVGDMLVHPEVCGKVWWASKSGRSQRDRLIARQKAWECPCPQEDAEMLSRKDEKTGAIRTRERECAEGTLSIKKTQRHLNLYPAGLQASKNPERQLESFRLGIYLLVKSKHPLRLRRRRSKNKEENQRRNSRIMRPNPWGYKKLNRIPLSLMISSLTAPTKPRSLNQAFLVQNSTVSASRVRLRTTVCL
ncbi:hypothetical protein C8R45DRAFT_935202 [Mycena sanguinolenta]|nr:hypothetical protein C8R45DRAFT_935202 [Mycena sanguinolenta]